MATASLVRCDCCELLRINGVICHEIGCPNMGKRWEGGTWVRYYECRECGFDVREGEPCSCQEEEGYGSDQGISREVSGLRRRRRRAA